MAPKRSVLGRPLRALLIPWLLVLPLAAQTAGSQPAPGTIVRRAMQLNRARPISFAAAVSSTSVFVGEQITYEMGIYIAEDALQRMRRNPEVVPAPLQGVIAYDLGTASTLPAIEQNGVRAVPHVLARALFPLTPGMLAIPASTVTYAIPRTTSYFSREESATLETRPLRVTVKPLPQSGQPATFTGAIGDLAIRLSVPASPVRIGEPVTVSVRVFGRGNAKLWPRPTLLVDSTMTSAPVRSTERVTVDSSTRVISGTHTFEWILTPVRAGNIQVGVQPYVYFAPAPARYLAATSDAAQLVVADAGSVATPTTGAVTSVATGLADYTSVDVAVPRWWRRVGQGGVVALAVAVVALCVAVFVTVRRRHIREDSAELPKTDAGAQLQALLAASQRPLDEPTVRTLLDAFLQQRVGLTVGELADATNLEGALRRAGVSRDTAHRLLDIRRELDRAVWGAGPRHTSHTLRGALSQAVSRLDAEALPRADAPLSRTPVTRVIS